MTGKNEEKTRLDLVEDMQDCQDMILGIRACLSTEINDCERVGVCKLLGLISDKQGTVKNDLAYRLDTGPALVRI